MKKKMELVIRILSFGPMIRVAAPVHFVDLMKERLQMQKSCGQ
ncbi:MAG TPA: WYL domain-containing protein [Candidatus Blautia faecipullorum]|nr:WYL domain-containing protein [Candidatus Blautia faecipullorum]